LVIHTDIFGEEMFIAQEEAADLTVDPGVASRAIRKDGEVIREII